MKIEIRCGACNKGFLVDERDTGAELSCPSCMAQIRLAVAAPAVAATQVATVPPAPVAAVANTAPDTPASRSNAENHPVVCPRCKLHFDPFGALALRESAKRIRRRVLIIEDLEYFRQVATDALTPKYEVYLAASAADAKSVLAREPVDLIVLDLDLQGGEDGSELVGSLRPKPCPILIFTAQDESDMYGERWEELRELGADDVVIKGMNAAESLQRKVDQLLGEPLDEDPSIG